MAIPVDLSRLSFQVSGRFWPFLAVSGRFWPFLAVSGIAFQDAVDADANSVLILCPGSDDADLDFDYLSEFGPRFKKLADIYGHHSSESEDDGGESWC